MNRTPPVEVRRRLRAEVCYVCAVPGCNSPYLTYHHFDPPWSEKQHHNLEGMIALCEHHHNEADVGTYTCDQLYKFKREAAVTEVRGNVNWRREKTIFRAGTCLFVSSDVVLYSRGKRLVWLSKSQEGFDLLNLDLFTPGGELLFQMREHDWLLLPPVQDFEAQPHGHSIDVRSDPNGVRLKLTFRGFHWGELGNLIGSTRWEADIGNALGLKAGDEVQLCDMTGKMRYPSHFHFTPTKMKVGSNTFVECFWAHEPLGIEAEDGEAHVVAGG